MFNIGRSTKCTLKILYFGSINNGGQLKHIKGKKQDIKWEIHLLTQIKNIKNYRHNSLEFEK